MYYLFAYLFIHDTIKVCFISGKVALKLMARKLTSYATVLFSSNIEKLEEK